MSNPILIHLNKKYHVPLDSIQSVTKKRWGSVWVAYLDKNGQKKAAIAKVDLGSMLNIINTHKIMRGQKPLEAIIEK